MNLPENELLDLAQSLIADRVVMQDWFPETMALWLRHDCRCAYCGLDFLQSRGIAYQFSTSDHILPQGKHPQFASAKWNLVLACRECNALKAQFDPSEAAERQAESPEQHRAVWLGRSREYVDRRRDELHKRFAEERRRILGALSGKAIGAGG